MARSIWNGAISFGLVHIPVELLSATSSVNVDFDWLDERTMNPVGYKRVNKVTGKEVTSEHIVKGIKYEKDRYIILEEDEIRSAHPKSTQTIDIFSFVDNSELPLIHIDTPYYLLPGKRGEKVYALLRETLNATGKVGLANVVLHTKQHLCAVMAIDTVLVLMLLRWPSEIKSLSTLDITDTTKKVELSKDEKAMAKRLVEDMQGQWDPDKYRDTFQEKIMALVEKKAREGKIEDLETEAGDESRKSADIIDLTELLRKSLGSNTSSAKRNKTTSAKPAKAKSTSSKSTSTKSTSTSRQTKSKSAGESTPKRRSRKA